MLPTDSFENLKDRTLTFLFARFFGRRFGCGGFRAGAFGTFLVFFSPRFIALAPIISNVKS